MLSWAMGIGGAVAALCVLGFPFYALGIPGINDAKNDYVRGWKMGLVAIVLYPLVYIGLLITHFVVKNRTEHPNRPQWEHTSALLFAIALGALIVRLIHTFYLVARNEKKEREKEG